MRVWREKFEEAAELQFSSWSDSFLVVDEITRVLIETRLCASWMRKRGAAHRQPGVHKLSERRRETEEEEEEKWEGRRERLSWGISILLEGGEGEEVRGVERNFEQQLRGCLLRFFSGSSNRICGLLIFFFRFQGFLGPCWFHAGSVLGAAEMRWWGVFAPQPLSPRASSQVIRSQEPWRAAWLSSAFSWRPGRRRPRRSCQVSRSSADIRPRGRWLGFHAQVSTSARLLFHADVSVTVSTLRHVNMFLEKVFLEKRPLPPHPCFQFTLH